MDGPRMRSAPRGFTRKRLHNWRPSCQRERPALSIFTSQERSSSRLRNCARVRIGSVRPHGRRIRQRRTRTRGADDDRHRGRVGGVDGPQSTGELAVTAAAAGPRVRSLSCCGRYEHRVGGKLVGQGGPARLAGSQVVHFKRVRQVRADGYWIRRISLRKGEIHGGI